MNQNAIYITYLEFFFKGLIQNHNQGFSKRFFLLQLHDYYMSNHMTNHKIIIWKIKFFKHFVICKNDLCGKSLDIKPLIQTDYICYC